MTRSVDSDAPSDEVPAKQRCDSFSDKSNNNNNEETSPQTYDRPNYGGKVVGILAGYSQQPELSGPSNTEIQVTYRLLREKLELEEKSEEQVDLLLLPPGILLILFLWDPIRRPPWLFGYPNPVICYEPVF